MALDPKDFRSVEWFYFDFSIVLDPDDSIATFNGVSQDSGDCVLTNAALVGGLVSVLVAGGTPGTSPVIRAEVDTVLGERLELLGAFLVTASPTA